MNKKKNRIQTYQSPVQNVLYLYKIRKTMKMMMMTIIILKKKISIKIVLIEVSYLLSLKDLFISQNGIILIIQQIKLNICSEINFEKFFKYSKIFIIRNITFNYVYNLQKIVKNNILVKYQKNNNFYANNKFFIFVKI